MGRLRLRVAVVAIAAVISGVVGVSAPASATIPWSGLTETIDCSTLQGGYYHAIQVTASASGLAASTQYTADLYAPGSTQAIGADIPVTTDAQGTATVAASLSGPVVSGQSYALLLWSGQTIVARRWGVANTCASGVTPRGTLTADAACPTRFLGTWGDVEDTSYHIHGTLTGFVPGETYTLATAYTGGSPSGVADQSGAVAFDLVVNGPFTWASAYINTTSQQQWIGSATWAVADPCPAMKTSFPITRPTESDVNGDGESDLLAIDFSGRLLYYQNASWLNPGGVPFSTSQTIGSGWGPQYGMRLETAGDLTNDGYSEIVAVRSDGSLVAYYNNMNSNPGRLPYTSATLIGSGWQSFTHVTLGDVNHDGFDDLIAERSDGTYWLYLNHYLSNPGHLPFTSGVRIASPGPESANGFAAVDSNSDGYSDLWGYAGWLNPNLAPAGNSQFYGNSLPVAQGALSNIGTLAPQSGWAVGHFTYSNLAPSILVANPNGDGTLVLIQDLTGAGGTPSRVIGSGWQSIRTIIS